jgi:hypothetical protein
MSNIYGNSDFEDSFKIQEEFCRDFVKRSKYKILRVSIEKGKSVETDRIASLKGMLKYNSTSGIKKYG